MKYAVSNALLSGVRDVFAQAPTRVFDETGVGAALLLTLTGMGLRIYAPRHQMSSEEHVKNGTLTPDEARRQVRFYEITATVVTLLGVAVLCWMLYDLAQ